MGILSKNIPAACFALVGFLGHLRLATGEGK